VFFRAVNNAGTKGAWSAVQNLYVDTVVLTLTRKVASYSMAQGANYPVTNLYTVSYGASGGNVVCKVGTTTVTNLNTLAIGTHTLSCTATSGANKVSSAISVSITVSKAYLVDVVNVGDFVNYNAGTWTSTAGIPTSNGSFGGYASGTNKSTGVACYGTSKGSYNGWRVLSKSGSGASGTVTLVHAGTPECYYHGETSTSTAISKLNSRASSQYVNTTYATSAHSFNCSDFQTATGTSCTAGRKPTGDLPGTSYWLTTQEEDVWLYYIEGLKGAVDSNCDADYGLRPVVVLKAGLSRSGGAGTSASPYNISV